jgi:hypothetical protein
VQRAHVAEVRSPPGWTAGFRSPFVTKCPPLCATASRLVLWPTQWTLGINRPEREANRSLSYSAEANRFTEDQTSRSYGVRAVHLLHHHHHHHF